ncbi:hypothetical protein B0H11DRAFT_2034750 [Mycena galericulata]|nr:hypothetical protein B0H11DRAFT_2034750 [Mycena galericulata]
MSLVLLVGHLSWIIGLSEYIYILLLPCLRLVCLLFFTNCLSNQMSYTVFTCVACQVVAVGTATKALKVHVIHHVFDFKFWLTLSLSCV